MKSFYISNAFTNNNICYLAIINSGEGKKKPQRIRYGFFFGKGNYSAISATVSPSLCGWVVGFCTGGVASATRDSSHFSPRISLV